MEVTILRSTAGVFWTTLGTAAISSEDVAGHPIIRWVEADLDRAVLMTEDRGVDLELEVVRPVEVSPRKGRLIEASRGVDRRGSVRDDRVSAANPEPVRDPGADHPREVGQEPVLDPEAGHPREGGQDPVRDLEAGHR